jgi:hypothetical protein
MEVNRRLKVTVPIVLAQAVGSKAGDKVKWIIDRGELLSILEQKGAYMNILMGCSRCFFFFMISFFPISLQSSHSPPSKQSLSFSRVYRDWEH